MCFRRGHRRVTIAPETKIPNAATLVIEREDHTLGNILRMCAARPRLHLCLWRARWRTQLSNSLGAHASASPRARRQLLEDKEVHFAGYRVPHPLEPAIQIKVQTRSNNPGPIDAVDSALNKLTNELTALSSSFEKSLKAYAQRTGTKPASSDGFQRAGASGDMDVE